MVEVDNAGWDSQVEVALLEEAGQAIQVLVTLSEVDRRHTQVETSLVDRPSLGTACRACHRLGMDKLDKDAAVVLLPIHR